MKDKNIDLCQKIVDKGLKMGADDIEVFYQNNKNIDIVWEKGDLQVPKSDDYQGVGIRVLKDNSMGFSATNVLEESEIEQNISQAIQIASAAPEEPDKYFPEPVDIDYVENLVDEANRDLSLADVMDKGREFVESALNYDSRVSLDNANFKSRSISRAIATSKGIKAAEEKTSFEMMAVAFAREEERVSSFDISFQNSCHLSDLKLAGEGRELAEKVISSLDAQSIESFRGSVILSPFSVLNLIAFPLNFSVNAENVIQGISPWKEKMGEAVAASSVNIVDDALIAGGVGSRSFDREGLPPKKVSIIENGQLNNYLHNSYTAAKLERESTGHAGGSDQNQPTITPSNFMIKTGSNSLEDIINNTEKGILVNRFSGNADPVSGDFSGIVKGGEYIEKGELVKPVKEVMISGNIYQLMHQISAIGNKSKQIMNFSLPYIKLEDVSITGS